MYSFSRRGHVREPLGKPHGDGLPDRITAGIMLSHWHNFDPADENSLINNAYPADNSTVCRGNLTHTYSLLRDIERPA